MKICVIFSLEKFQIISKLKPHTNWNIVHVSANTHTFKWVKQIFLLILSISVYMQSVDIFYQWTRRTFGFSYRKIDGATEWKPRMVDFFIYLFCIYDKQVLARYKARVGIIILLAKKMKIINIKRCKSNIFYPVLAEASSVSWVI